MANSPSPFCGNAGDPDAPACRYARESDTIGRFFLRPFFLSLTIGVPFCIYKMIFGISILRAGAAGGSLLPAFGWLIILWAVADLLMNCVYSLQDLWHLPARYECCTLAQVGRLFSRPMVFLALDTLLSFSIICLMLWSGWIATLLPFENVLWYTATTLNLVSLSVVSLYNEIRKV
ncbi:MAG: hypothetical protein Q7T80_12790 [Methanoregula sp.]|nr:hypothetical protein [Methanoregula sp.]